MAGNPMRDSEVPRWAALAAAMKCKLRQPVEGRKSFSARGPSQTSPSLLSLPVVLTGKFPKEETSLPGKTH